MTTQAFSDSLSSSFTLGTSPTDPSAPQNPEVTARARTPLTQIPLDGLPSADLEFTHPHVIEMRSDAVLEGDVKIEASGANRTCFIDARFGSIGWRSVEQTFLALQRLVVVRLQTDDGQVQLRVGAVQLGRHLYPAARLHLTPMVHHRLTELGAGGLKPTLDLLRNPRLWDDPEQDHALDFTAAREARDVLPNILPSGMIVSTFCSEDVFVPRQMSSARPKIDETYPETLKGLADGFCWSRHVMYLLGTDGRRIEIYFDEEKHLQHVVELNTIDRPKLVVKVTIARSSSTVVTRTLESAERIQAPLIT